MLENDLSVALRGIGVARVNERNANVFRPEPHDGPGNLPENPDRKPGSRFLELCQGNRFP